MSDQELRDPEEARRFVEEGLWLARASGPHASGVRPALEWALEVASIGLPLPPLGFLADLGTILYVPNPVGRAGKENIELPGVPAGLIRTYEDHVLGKFFADWSFERGGDALRRYQGRDRARGLAFVVQQFRERAGFTGVHLSPAILRGVLDKPPDAVLASGFELLSKQGLSPLAIALYESLIAAARRCPEVLGPEDLFELERGTALSEMGQRVALRQVLKVSAQFEAQLPLHRPRSQSRRREVATRIFDDDVYPVGGYSSLSNRGSIESLLHSQLAYMEGAGSERPDLFDIKFLRDELLYYARDENQFLRRRRSFVFALHADLAAARFKDPELPWQRGILLLGLLLAGVRKLIDWLSDDALRFEFLFVETTEDEEHPLADERELLELILREQVANGTVHFDTIAEAALAEHCTRLARRSLCHCLNASSADRPWAAEETESARLVLDAAAPALGFAEQEAEQVEADSALEAWHKALERLVGTWL
ncbi:MAG: hypothetical protein AB7K24_16180 [Gemmataceae bacterium]